MSLELFAPPLALVVGALGAARLLARACGVRESELPLGAQLLAGVALFCALAGWLVAAGAYSRGAGYALCGLAALGFVLPRSSHVEPAPGSRLTLASAMWLLPIGVFVVARGLGALRFPHYNWCDDFVQYLHFPRLLLETGAFEEPFSTRRLGVLGSGQLVQSFFAPGFGVSANAVADALFGIPALIGAALLARSALARDAKSPHFALAFVLVALLGTLTLPIVNTLPVLLPYASGLALFALHARLSLREPDAASTRDAALFGAIAAFAIGLRVSNGVLPAALWAFALARALAQRDHARLRLALFAALATALALAPWCLSLWRSSGTPLFPLFAGNYRFDALFAEPMSSARLAEFALECALAARVPALIALAALASAVRAQRVLALEIAAATLLLLATTTLATTAFDSWTVLRYVAPLSTPALLVLGALALRGREASRAGRAALAALAAVWFLAPVTSHRVFDEERFSPLSIARGDAQQWALALQKVVRSGFTLEAVAGAEQFRAAQAALPRGAWVVSTAEQPWEWRYDANTIHSLDFLGPTSPPPGIPFFRGPEPVREYFTSLGYTHLAFTRPRRSLCLYSFEFARMNLHKGQWLWRTWAPYTLDFLGNELELARSSRVVFAGPTLVVIDLRQRAAP